MNGCTVLAKPEGCHEWQPFALSFDGPENLLTSGAEPSDVLHETLEGFSEIFGSVSPVPCPGRLAVPEALLPCQLVLSKKPFQ